MPCTLANLKMIIQNEDNSEDLDSRMDHLTSIWNFQDKLDADIFQLGSESLRNLTVII